MPSDIHIDYWKICTYLNMIAKYYSNVCIFLLWTVKQSLTVLVEHKYLIIFKRQALVIIYWRFCALPIRVPSYMPSIQWIRRWFFCIDWTLSWQWTSGAHVISFHISYIAIEWVSPVVVDNIAPWQIWKRSHRMPFRIEFLRWARSFSPGRSLCRTISVTTKNARECRRMI